MTNRKPATVPESTELKPCPFCSGIARWGESDDGGHYIECSKCQATTNLTYFIMEDASDKMREAWNQRTPAASPVAGVSAEIEERWEAVKRSSDPNDEVWHVKRVNPPGLVSDTTTLVTPVSGMIHNHCSEAFARRLARLPELERLTSAAPSAEGDGWIAELRDGLKLVRLALADENVDGVPTWTRMRFWLNQRDIYNGDLQGHRVTFEVVKRLLTLLPVPVAKEGRES